MSSTWQLPGYVALAHRAAAALGAGSDPIVSAILAQWQCEQPNPAPWPPLHNNPGNLTRLIGSLAGPPPPVATTAPGAGLLYAYPTPEAGADAYARYLLSSTRYPVAIAAARRGDAAGFLTAVCGAGYGTRLSCCLSLLPAVRLSLVPAAPHRWQCAGDVVNVRSGPSTGSTIIGTIHKGAIVSAPEVAGGTYVGLGSTYSGWLALGGGRYTAAAFYRKLS